MNENTGKKVHEHNRMKLYTKDLVKKYKKRVVVNHVSVEVSQGEIVGLLGPNGAGKTTTFYMIVGLIKPNKGSIHLDKKNITTEPMYKRAQLGIGYLAQEASVFRSLSVEDNIRAVLEFTDKGKEEQQEKLESLLDEFGLQYIRKSKGITLSGGNGAAPKSHVRLRLTQALFCLTSLLQALTQ